MLQLCPITWKEACAFIALHHSHHMPGSGWKFGVGVNDGEKLVGVVTVGRPVSRVLDDGFTLEVTRNCTDRTPHVCSMLYGAARRVAKDLGFHRLITYTLLEEDGTSLKAVGWKAVHQTEGGSWSTPSRLRVDKHPLGPKMRWETEL